MPRRPHDGLGLGRHVLSAALAPQGQFQAGGGEPHEPVAGQGSDVDAAIYDGAAELGLDDSKYLRACVFLAGPLLKAHPVLVKFNRRELEELAANIGNTLVIRPAAVEVRRGDW